MVRAKLFAQGRERLLIAITNALATLTRQRRGVPIKGHLSGLYLYRSTRHGQQLHIKRPDALGTFCDAWMRLDLELVDEPPTLHSICSHCMARLNRETAPTMREAGLDW